MALLGIDHVQLAMPHGGEPHARAFFVGLLEMDEVAKPAQLAVNGGCWFASGPVHIHCGVEEGFLPARRAHPALVVDDLDALVQRLNDAGVPFRAGKPLDGYLRGDIADPFGNRIELMQRT
ncbi:VOC family protein [Qipengyuania marisflavi]|uniref:Glyoxalase n=1 Tax=Qipengyuania marisflavi TaxID=2486356 RepID=A0A5S3P267_9SPHN|nr:VOC family protein [Qipengyuania marisflavi]TMM46749.1 glyoxalase [Qipengyuania marisflavi]